MGSAHSSIPGTSPASGPIRPAGAIALPPMPPRPTGAASLPPGTIPTRNPVPVSVSDQPSISATVQPLGQQPKLLDRLREALRSRHYSRLSAVAQVGLSAVTPAQACLSAVAQAQAGTFRHSFATHPHKMSGENDTTEDRAHRFTAFDWKAALESARDILTGSAVFCSYLDPDTSS